MQPDSPHPFVAAVRATARRRSLLAPGDRVLAALSGGPDSTALLAALAALRDAGAVSAVYALHVDHGLRPGAEADAACAAEACSRLAVPFTSIRVKVRRGNVQAEARRARYAALRAEAARRGATRIATGHTRTDQAETVLLRLLRGAGARGLSGIPARRGILVRPLLDRSREEVLAFLAAQGLRWREDPTNATDRFARNRVRHALLPVLRALAPHAERAIARTAELLRDDDRALRARARRLLSTSEGAQDLERGRPAEASLRALRAAPIAVRRRVVREAFRAAGGRGQLGAARVEEVLALARRDRPGRLALPGRLEARCRYGRFSIGVRSEPVAAPVEVVPVPGPGRYVLPAALAGAGGVAASRAAVIGAAAPARVPWPLELRGRRPGDRFHPDGGPGAKKLKAWLIDRKVPRERRDGLWLLARGREVLAIPELGARAQGTGPAEMGLEVHLEGSRREPRPGCKGGARLL